MQFWNLKFISYFEIAYFKIAYFNFLLYENSKYEILKYAISKYEINFRFQNCKLHNFCAHVRAPINKYFELRDWLWKLAKNIEQGEKTGIVHHDTDQHYQWLILSDISYDSIPNVWCVYFSIEFTQEFRRFIEKYDFLCLIFYHWKYIKFNNLEFGFYYLKSF